MGYLTPPKKKKRFIYSVNIHCSYILQEKIYILATTLLERKKGLYIAYNIGNLTTLIYWRCSYLIDAPCLLMSRILIKLLLLKSLIN